MMQSSTLRTCATLAAALAAIGCASDTIAPSGPFYIYHTQNSPIAQVASAGSAVAVAPAVSVERNVVPQANVRVNFVVTLGGGRVAEAVATTDAHGVASAGVWILGAEGANEVVASIDGGPSLAFGGYAFDLPTGADAYDLVGHDGESLPADEGHVGDQYKLIAERLILLADSTYSATMVDYNVPRREFAVRSSGGTYTRAGVTLAITRYAGTENATGAFQVDLLAIHAVIPGSDDTAPYVTDDLYRRVRQ
jgi:hypothetical protein